MISDEERFSSEPCCCLFFLQMMAAFQDILTNPGNMAKYKDDPEVADAISKLMRKFGGGMAGGSGIPH